MSKIRSIFAIALLLGLVLAEFWPSMNNPEAHSASSPQAEANQANLMASILDNYMDADYQIPDRSKPSTFVNFDLPKPSDLGDDAMSIAELSSYNSAYLSSGLTLPNVYDSTPAPSAILNNIVPPFGSPLYYAYQDGARAWYQKGYNVLAIYPDGRIGSFNASTGMKSDWLKRELAYEPIDDANAISNYQTNYRAVTVAKTTRWVLMEFPSGGVIKVIKPEYASSNQQTTGTDVGGLANGNLPNILPGYQN